MIFKILFAGHLQATVEATNEKEALEKALKNLEHGAVVYSEEDLIESNKQLKSFVRKRWDRLFEKEK